MIQTNCITLSPAANAEAKTKLAQLQGTQRLGFRFESTGAKHSFQGVQELRVKDYVVQPVLNGVVVFIDPDSLEKGYGTDIDFDGKQFVFSKSARAMPKVAEKTQEQKAHERAMAAASRATKGMAAGPEKAAVAKAAKEASLAKSAAKALEPASVKPVKTRAKTPKASQ